MPRSGSGECPVGRGCGCRVVPHPRALHAFCMGFGTRCCSLA
jgi:hypothetical protein